MRRKGFTLLEVLAAVAVLVVLAAGTVPAWRSLADESLAIHRARAAEEALFARTAAELWRLRDEPGTIRLQPAGAPAFEAVLEIEPLPDPTAGEVPAVVLEPVRESDRERFVVAPPARRWATARIRALEGGGVLARRVFLLAGPGDSGEEAP